LAQPVSGLNGIPSHDTFGRVFARLDTQAFRESFLSWVQAVFTVTAGQVVPIDGKTLRRSHDKTVGKEAISMVSAWATTNHLVLGRVKVESKSNEITAIPVLLTMLELTGCIITIDAIGTQTEIAEQIVNQGGGYLLAVKENQPHLHEDIQLFFQLARQNEFAKVTHTYHRTANGGHGRIEVRHCWAISGQDSLAFLRGHGNWPKLQCIVMFESERWVKEQVERQTHYFITSLDNDARSILAARRAHWGIENQLYWVLDVAFREDHSRVRQGNADHLLKQEKTAKGGIKAKRLQAAWNEDYLVKVLSG
jgi:predicted transposase YbfD/YdcC